MKYLFTCLCLLIAMQLSAQKWVVFDRSDATSAIFDETDPFSLVSILATNNGLLQDYIIEGVPYDVFNQLNAPEKSALLCYLGPYSDIPFIDEDPTSPNFGNYLIVEDESGNQMYAYPPRDSLFIGIRNLDRIAFVLQEGQSPGINTLKQIELYKEINGKMVSMGVLDAAIMDMTLWTVPRFLTEEETNALMAPNGLYSRIRDEAIERKKEFETVSDDYNSGYYSTYLDYFPWSFLNLTFYPYSIENQAPEGRFSNYDPEELIVNCIPISLELATAFINHLMPEEAIESRFDSVLKVSEQSNVPLMDEDPNSEHFGDLLVRVIDDVVGVYEYVYPAPRTRYVFLDFKPIFLTSQKIKRNQEGNLELMPYSLLWLQEAEQGPPEVIASMSLYTEKGLIPELEEQLKILKPRLVSEDQKLQRLIDLFEDKRFLVDLPLDRIPTTIGKNKKDKYALVKGEHLMTKYIFKETPIALPGNLFQTRQKETTEIRTDRGEVIFQGDFDAVFPFVMATGLFALRKDSLWTVLSAKKGQHFDWIEIPDAEVQFTIDGANAYCYVEDENFIVKKNDLMAIINIDGVQKVDFKFSELHGPLLIQFGDDYTIIDRKCWLGFEAVSQEWVVLDEQFKEIARRKGGSFLQDWGDVIIFDDGKKVGLLNPFDGNTSIDQLSISDGYREIKQGFTPICVINPEGNYIVPPTGAEIARVEIDSLVFFMVMDPEGLKMIAVNGEVVGDLPGHRHAYQGCVDKDILFISKDGKHGITRYNKETRKLEVIHAAKYGYLTCAPSGAAYLVSTKNEGGKTLYLFEDGRVEE